ncbi:DUF805 domain-containing protein [Actinomadura rubrisoli]|nr:DUF805 domain-containing protein [Actinomadura rubrisoli]
MVGFFSAITRAFKQYWSFRGRASRSEFWFFVLFADLCFLLVVLGAMLPASDVVAVVGSVGIFATLAVFLPLESVLVRRLHDSGLSGAWWWLEIVPFVGPLVLIVLLCRPSYPGINRYGPHPSATEEQLARQLFEQRNKGGERVNTIADIAVKLGVSRATVFRCLDPEQQRQAREARAKD